MDTNKINEEEYYKKRREQILKLIEKNNEDINNIPLENLKILKDIEYKNKIIMDKTKK